MTYVYVPHNPSLVSSILTQPYFVGTTFMASACAIYRAKSLPTLFASVIDYISRDKSRMDAINLVPTKHCYMNIDHI